MNRSIIEVVEGHNTTDGAGVPLKRILSLPHVKRFDPFLMLDSFGSDSPEPGPGFPWHPHRGIITISYMLKGSISHEDSLGNSGTITAGGVQWMKAASGIIHQEMPKPGPNGIRGFQFWLNMPAHEKMSDPDYADILSGKFSIAIPSTGVAVKVVAGEFGGVKGLVAFNHTEPEFYEITLERGATVKIPTPVAKNFFVVGIEGVATINEQEVETHAASLLSAGDCVEILAREQARLLLVGGNRLDEPIAWSGPIVMNTDQELRLAYDEYYNGTFIKKSNI